VLEATVLDEAQIQAGVAEAERVVGLRNVSQSPANLAGLGVIPADATPGVNLYQPSAGGATTLRYDIDSDGSDEDVQVFLASGGAAYLAWREEGHCRLTFRWNNIGWYFDAVCGEDGALVCRYESAVECVLCDADLCAPCAVDELDLSFVSCEEIVVPEPDVGLDTAPDIVPGLDTSPGEDVPISPDGGSVLPDVPSEDTPADDTGTSPGGCEAECMSASEAICCTTCACAPDDCRPACERSGYTWDCEVQCCFNYDLLECDDQ